MSNDTLIKEAIEQTIDEASLYAPDLNWDEVLILSKDTKPFNQDNFYFSHRRLISIAASILLIAVVSTLLLTNYIGGSDDVDVVEDTKETNEIVETVPTSITTTTTLPATSTTVAPNANRSSTTPSTGTPQPTVTPTTSIVQSLEIWAMQPVTLNYSNTGSTQTYYPRVELRTLSETGNFPVNVTVEIVDYAGVNSVFHQYKLNIQPQQDAYTIVSPVGVPIGQCQRYWFSMTVEWDGKSRSSGTADINPISGCP